MRDEEERDSSSGWDKEKGDQMGNIFAQKRARKSPCRSRRFWLHHWAIWGVEETVTD
jgi:hypothetical protein